MAEYSRLPTIENLKAEAKVLRIKLGSEIGHSQALEFIAKQYGYRDWNTLYAVAGNGPPPCPVILGQMVVGHYLKQPFLGEVIGIESLGGGSRYRVILDFAEPVDVITFEGMSNFRKRVQCIVDTNGRTSEKTSDGVPQLVINL